MFSKEVDKPRTQRPSKSETPKTVHELECWIIDDLARLEAQFESFVTSKSNRRFFKSGR